MHTKKLTLWTLASTLALARLGWASEIAPPLPVSASVHASSAALRIQGLRQPVRVLRDRWGVAHIYAKNEHDLFFAQGVVAAQDRLFQMEIWKRAGQGRLSEILGESALQRDIDARALQYRGDMQAEYNSYADKARAILVAFTDGINAYVATLGRPGGAELPLEFQRAGFTPDAWHPEDCLNRMAAFSMTGNAISELHSARTLTELGPQRAALALHFDPPAALDPAPGMDLSDLSPELLKDLIGSDQRIEFAHPPREGSNNWTISGALTSTGKPLLANDPHRVLALPSLRYMVHLVAPGWDVIGAGEPGLPGVALGHNQKIAWGFTIFGLDQQDLYVEELNPLNPLEYRTEDGWAEMSTRTEQFLVKGAPARTVQLKFTRHGPVLWDDGKRALALRWVGSEPGTAGYLASLAIDQAQDWQQFEAAMARWKVPSENIVYADRTGNIGEHSVGLAPMRHWSGLLPVPGAGGYEWDGYLPAAQLPHVLNPAAGFVATANQKTIPENYPYRVGFEWDAPYRYNRIRAVIEEAARSQHKLTVPDLEALQNDVLSLPAAQLQSLLRTTTLQQRAELTDFMRWDGGLGRKSAPAALYEAWLRQICVRLGARFSPLHPDRYADLTPDVVIALLAKPDQALFGADPSAGRDELLSEALLAARQELPRRLGTEPAKWTWGALHQMHFRHPLYQLPGAEGQYDLGPVPRPGDGYTVNATSFDENWEQVAGASYRQIVDTSDWDRSVAINTPGQSGRPGTRHYADLLPLWDSGSYFPLAYSRHAVDKATLDRLTLEP